MASRYTYNSGTNGTVTTGTPPSGGGGGLFSGGGSSVGGGGGGNMAASGLMGALNPASLGSAAGNAGVSLALGAGAGLLSEALGKAGKRRAKARRAAYIDGQRNRLTDSAESSKDSIRRNLVEARSQIGQSMVDRGLYSSSALDGVTQQANTAAAEQMANIDQNKANTLAGITENAYASPLPGGNYGEALGGILQSAFTRPPQRPADNRSDPSQNESQGGGGLAGAFYNDAASGQQALTNLSPFEASGGLYQNAALGIMENRARANRVRAAGVRD